jgi:hypothetical protein
MGMFFTQFGAASFMYRLRILIISGNSKIAVETASVVCLEDDDIILTGGIAQAIQDLESDEAKSSNGAQGFCISVFLFERSNVKGR